MIFQSDGKLKEFLESIAPGYGVKYANSLWAKGVGSTGRCWSVLPVGMPTFCVCHLVHSVGFRSIGELAVTDVEILIGLGVEDIHALYIKAEAAAGK